MHGPYYSPRWSRRYAEIEFAFGKIVVAMREPGFNFDVYWLLRDFSEREAEFIRATNPGWTA